MNTYHVRHRLLKLPVECQTADDAGVVAKALMDHFGGPATIEPRPIRHGRWVSGPGKHHAAPGGTREER